MNVAVLLDGTRTDGSMEHVVKRFELFTSEKVLNRVFLSRPGLAIYTDVPEFLDELLTLLIEDSTLPKPELIIHASCANKMSTLQRLRRLSELRVNHLRRTLHGPNKVPS